MTGLRIRNRGRLWLALAALALFTCCREGEKSVIYLAASPAQIQADGVSSLQLQLVCASDFPCRPQLRSSLGRIVELKSYGRAAWRATLRAGDRSGRVFFSAPGYEVRGDPVYFFPPSGPPPCSRSDLADYSLTLDGDSARAEATASTVDNIFAGAVAVSLFPTEPFGFDGETATATVLVEGTSLATDLFDVRLTVDTVSGGSLLNTLKHDNGEAYFDFGDFPATAAATLQEGMPALWYVPIMARLSGGTATVTGRVTASTPCPQDETANLRIRPFLTQRGAGNLTLVWETDRETNTFAAIGPTSACPQVAAGTVERARVWTDPDFSYPPRFTSFVHRVVVPLPSPAQSVYYRVPPLATPTPPEAFTFGALPGETFTFGVISDTQLGHTVHAAIIQRMLRYPLDFYLHAGDLVQDSGNQGQWRTFFDIEAPLMKNVPFFPSIGNHDFGDFHTFYGRYFNADGPDVDNFGLSMNPLYSFDYGNSHFVFIATSLPFNPTSIQYLWLEADLAAAQAKPGHRFTFVTQHHPMYSIFSDFTWLSDQLEPLYQAYGVDAVFYGHLHLYERSDVLGRPYICAAGGGAPLRAYPTDYALNPYFVTRFQTWHFLTVTVEPDRFTIRAIDMDGNVFDQTAYSQ